MPQECTPCVIIVEKKKYEGAFDIQNHCIVAYHVVKGKVKDYFYNIDDLMLNVH